MLKTLDSEHFAQYHISMEYHVATLESLLEKVRTVRESLHTIQDSIAFDKLKLPIIVKEDFLDELLRAEGFLMGKLD